MAVNHPRQFLLELYQSAMAAVDTSGRLPPYLPAPPDTWRGPTWNATRSTPI